MVDAGGCPAPGTPQQRQLLQLTALAVEEWLPVLLTQRPSAAAPAGAVIPTPLRDLLPHGAYRVAWAWLRLVALQEARSAGREEEKAEEEKEEQQQQQQQQQGGGTALQRPWNEFLTRRVNALGQVVQVACGGKVQPGLQPGSGVNDPECVSAALEVLPAAKDVLQVVVGTDTREVARALGETKEGQEAKSMLGGQGRLGWGPGLLLDGAGRGLKPGEGRGELEGMLGTVMKGQVQKGPAGGSCSGGGVGRVPLLPHPGAGAGGEALAPRCEYAWCCNLEGRSEAEVRLRACGRCRAVGYCSAECQKADWAAGHKAVCGKAAGAPAGA